MAKVKIGNVYPTHKYLMDRCAPAGFGLGGNGELIEVYSISEIDSLSNNGWYDIHSGNTMSAGGFTFTACLLEVSMLNEDNGWHILRFFGTTATLNRYKINNVWSEWEWDAPPLALGVEYKTTERWQNKPVYACLVNAGTYPESGLRNVSTEIGATGIVRFNASIGYASLPLADNMEINTFHDGGKISIQLNTKGERIYSNDVYVTLYYIKA